jgi:hypothetical protein
MTAGQGSTIIEGVSRYIDYKLSAIYGTHTPCIFGTNSLGTTDVPRLIVNVACDLALGEAYQNAALSISQSQRDWGSAIYVRGYRLLDELCSLNRILPEYQGTIQTDSALPYTIGASAWYTELLNLSGTSLTQLTFPTVLANTITVYGTQSYSPPVYSEGRDWKAIYWREDGAVGTQYGYISSTGTGSLTGDVTVMVTYKYKLSPIFRTNDYRKWGEVNPEERG